MPIRHTPVVHEHQPPHRRMARHLHRHGYVTVVVKGGYQEAGDHGRFRLESGHVLVHAPFDAHADLIGPDGSVMLNLPLDGDPPVAAGCYEIADPDAVIRLAERDGSEALACLVSSLRPGPRGLCDWPDLLAQDLQANPATSLSHWARLHGLVPETISRGFRAAYGATPRRFRAAMRTKQAVRTIQRTPLPLAVIASDSGFADQSHLCRSVRELTGQTPSALRVKPVQDGPAPPG